MAYESDEEELDIPLEEKNKNFFVGKCGIKNIGNTCYMNAALQSILASEEFAMYYFNRMYEQDLKNVKDKESYMLSAKFAKFIRLIKMEKRTEIAPWIIKT